MRPVTPPRGVPQPLCATGRRFGVTFFAAFFFVAGAGAAVLRVFFTGVTLWKPHGITYFSIDFP